MGYIAGCIACVVFIVAMTYSEINRDPRERVMKDCIGIASSEEHKLECAKVIYGKDNE